MVVDSDLTTATPFDAGLGAKGTDVNLSRSTKVDADAIYEAFLAYQVLVICGQAMTPLEQFHRYSAI